MLLGNKKTQRNEQNWSLILNPIFSELDKRKVARKISDAFALSGEESTDLVNNTPIILLDNLTRDVATKVKEYFKSSGAEILMTDETHLKRKCYRTVWPEPPSLSFLHEAEKKEDVKSENHENVETSEKLDPSEALNEIRSLSGESDFDEDSDLDTESLPDAETNQYMELMQELDRLKKERDTWREKFNAQRRTLDKLSWDMSLKEKSAKESNAAAFSEQQALENHKKMLDRANQKYESLQREYAEARSLFEQKLSEASGGAKEWRKKVDDLEESLKEEKGAKEKLNAQLSEQQRQIEEGLEKQERLEREIKEYQNTLKEDETLKRDYENLKEKVKNEREEYYNLQESYDSLKSEMHELRTKSETDLGEWKARVQTYMDKTAALEKSQAQLITELEERSAEAQEWERSCREHETIARELQNSHDNLEKMLHVNLKHLENRERELEQAKRQLREAKTKSEQQELLHKRTQIQDSISQKERRLKELVSQQEMTEHEIRAREELIRKILAEQEVVEKEILDNKQSQRHYLEQIKKEKSSRIKIKREIPQENEES